MKRQTDSEIKLYTLMILVENTPGVLSQVARLFSRKGYNIESIVSGDTEREGITRITICIQGDEAMIDLIAAQCRKLYSVLAVKVIDPDQSILWETAMIKVETPDRNTREEVIQMANIFRAKIIDVGSQTLIVSVMGSRSKTDALVSLLRPYGILEIAKTGNIAIERGRSTIFDNNKIREEYDYGKDVL